MECDLCLCKAEYDAKSKWGWWAYMCRHCFKHFGVGLGLGKGQKLEETK